MPSDQTNPSAALASRSSGVLARLRRMALDKLTADVPKYPALANARARWEGN